MISRNSRINHFLKSPKNTPMQYRHYYIIHKARTELASNGSIKLTIITNHLTQINFNIIRRKIANQILHDFCGGLEFHTKGFSSTSPFYVYVYNFQNALII